MKIIGALILIAGLGLGIYALTMSVGVELPSKTLGFGITTPSVNISDAKLVAERQNYLVFSAILSVTGAILLGMGVKGKK